MHTEPVPAGTLVRISGGYDFEPTWLSGADSVAGSVLKWIPGQNSAPACVVLLDSQLTAEGDVDGRRQLRTGVHLVLELRYTGQGWEHSGTVHVELCAQEPSALRWQDREHGAWVESHATYTFQ